MESFLRNNPSVRWTIISFLLIVVLLQAVAIANRVLVADAPPEIGGDLPPADGEGASPENDVTLSCQTVEYVNLRRDPFVGEANKITTLSEGTPFVAAARYGPVPWLYIRDETGNEGWLSSMGTDENPLVECEGELQSLPEREPSTSGTIEEVRDEENPEEESSPEAAAPETEPTITAAPALRIREGNGPNLHAAPRTFEITIDGDLSEWDATSAASIANPVYGEDNWVGPNDASGMVRAAWDESSLYLAAQLTDDHIVQESRDKYLHKGDAVEFFFDTDLQANFELDKYTDEIAQMIFSPGNFENNGPSAWVYFSPTGNFRDKIEVVPRRTEAGYEIEVRLPWERLNVQPEAGLVFGYAVALSDDDTPGAAEQESQIATTPLAPYNHPTRWANFILD